MAGWCVHGDASMPICRPPRLNARRVAMHDDRMRGTRPCVALAQCDQVVVAVVAAVMVAAVAEP